MSTPAFVYNNARYLFATGQLNWPASAINAMLVNGMYTPTLADLYVNAIPSSAIIARDVALTSLGVSSSGVCYGSIPQYAALVATTAVVAIVLYVKGANDSVSPLIYYSSGGVGFPFNATGFNYLVTYDQSQGGWFQL